MQIKATITPANAKVKVFKWTSSNSKIATVSKTGKVTGKKTGTVTITAKTMDGTNKTFKCKVRVLKTAVKKITLNKTKLSLKKGKSYTLSASVSPSNVDIKGVKWTSSNPKAATVSSKGKVTAKGKGTATITATAKDKTGKTKSCKVTVK